MFLQAWRHRALYVEANFSDASQKILRGLKSTLLLEALQILVDFVDRRGFKDQATFTIERGAKLLCRDGVQDITKSILILCHPGNRKLCRVNRRAHFDELWQVGPVWQAAEIDQVDWRRLGLITSSKWTVADGLEVYRNFGVPIFEALDLKKPKINVKSWHDKICRIEVFKMTG